MKKLKKIEKNRSVVPPGEMFQPKSPAVTSPLTSNKIVSDSPPSPSKSNSFLNNILGDSPLPQSAAAVYLYDTDEEENMETQDESTLVREVNGTSNGHGVYPSPAAVSEREGEERERE